MTKPKGFETFLSQNLNENKRKDWRWANIDEWMDEWMTRLAICNVDVGDKGTAPITVIAN